MEGEGGGESTDDGWKGGRNGREQGMGEEIRKGATEYVPLHIYATWAVTIDTRLLGTSAPEPVLFRVRRKECR